MSRFFRQDTMSVHTECIYHCLIVFTQVQTNDSDCGLFAAAFAMAICCGQVPDKLFLDVQQMRGHLSSCFISKKMKAFSSKKHNIKIGTKEETGSGCLLQVQTVGEPEDGLL